MKKILLLLIVISFLSCNRKIQPLQSESFKESTATVTLKRDTVAEIYIPGDTLKEVMPLFTASLTDVIAGAFTPPSELKTSLATSVAFVANGKLEHRLVQADTTLRKTIKDAIVTSSTSTITEKESTVATRVNYLTGWQWFLLWTGKIALLLLVVVAGLVMFRKYFNV